MPRSTKDLVDERMRQIELAIEQIERRSWTRPIPAPATPHYLGGRQSLGLMGGLGLSGPSIQADTTGKLSGLKRGRRR